MPPLWIPSEPHPDQRSSGFGASSSMFESLLTIRLPTLDDEREPVLQGPRRIGVGRNIPAAYRGNMADRLIWATLPDGRIKASFEVVSPGAEGIRTGLRASLPPDSTMRFWAPGRRARRAKDRTDTLRRGFSSQNRWRLRHPGAVDSGSPRDVGRIGGGTNGLVADCGRRRHWH